MLVVTFNSQLLTRKEPSTNPPSNCQPESKNLCHVDFSYQLNMSYSCVSTTAQKLEV